MAELTMTYHKVDGLLYPDIQMPEEQEVKLTNLGKYGILAMHYLKLIEPRRYKTLD